MCHSFRRTLNLFRLNLGTTALNSYGHGITTSACNWLHNAIHHSNGVFLRPSYKCEKNDNGSVKVTAVPVYIYIYIRVYIYIYIYINFHKVQYIMLYHHDHKPQNLTGAPPFSHF